MDLNFHSVTLDSDKCKGCITCVSRCPTEAIRVRNGKAKIISELCIDCGECIRLCPHHAKKAVYDHIDILDSFTYKIALPAPSLYGQFSKITDIDYVLTALKKLGFDDVYEVSQAAELVSKATRQIMNGKELKKPVISSACPAVERLIRARFPSLCENVLPILSPMEIAARLAKQKAADETGLPQESIGAFFISPCPAKITDIKKPLGCDKSAVDGALAIKDLYPRLLNIISKIDEPEQLSKSGIIGVSWAGSGGEATALLGDKYLAADGIENVIKVLEEVEGDKLNNLDFIELNACIGGCVGGVLTVENPYVAKTKIQLLRKYMPVSRIHKNDKLPDGLIDAKPLQSAPVMKLSDDVNEALKMMKEIDEIESRLPALDCGSCGAPSCRALAEDIVRGFAKEGDCVFRLRDQIEALAKNLADIEEYIPVPFRERTDKNDG